ncbi:MAG: glycosyltransferase family 2 protein [Xanthomonadales bacterium]|nr:glycosyltransferase family 2 protein [Xanthomonadales bacterium]
MAPLVWKKLMSATDGTVQIDVVIVNYNAGDALVRCVSSVLSQQTPVRITVTDNASTDDSMKQLQSAFAGSAQVKLIANDTNLGFARAVNAAVSRIGEAARYLLILNPDCELLTGSLPLLVAALDQDTGAAIAGPAVVDRQGQPMKGTMRRFPNPWNAFLTFSGLWRMGRFFPAFQGVDGSTRLPATTVEAEAVSGACMLLRADLFHQVNGLDESYGLHCEDLDLMFRLRERGYHCLLVPAAQVFHQQGLSSSSRPVWVHWQKHLGMQRFFLKFQASRHVFPMRWLVLAGIWIRFALTLPLVLIRS